MWFFKFIVLVELLEKLYKDKEFTAIYCASGRIWVRKLGFAEACPAEGIYYDAPADWQERVRPLGQYPAWMVRLVAYLISGESLIYKTKQHQQGDWSLDVVR